MAYLDTDVVIVDAVRTAMGRSKGGCFRHVRAEQLMADLWRALLDRNSSIDASEIDDVLCGCVNQTLEQGFNIARHSVLLSGMPHRVPAQTINRLCGSSMSALHIASQGIKAQAGGIYFVGGVEHMGHVPMTQGVDINPKLSINVAKAAMMMGLTAEMLAKMQQVSRDAQDSFALRSQRLATQAESLGWFSKEIIGVAGHDVNGFLRMITKDEVIRKDTTLDGLAQLNPVFIPNKGTVTAGNASAISDGASALLVLSGKKARELGVKPKARVRATSVVGCDPSVMGYGPVPATQQVLKQLTMTLDDIDCFEINEAFAAQTLAVIQSLKLTDRVEDSINLQGGAIALGHPLGCSGTRIVTSLMNVLEQRDKQWGLATMCIGMGQGIATVIERL